MKKQEIEISYYYDIFKDEAMKLATKNKLLKVQEEIKQMGGYELLISSVELRKQEPNLFKIKKCAYQDVLYKVEKAVNGAMEEIQDFKEDKWSDYELRKRGRELWEYHSPWHYAKILNLTKPNSKIHTNLRAGYECYQKEVEKKKRLEREKLEEAMKQIQSDKSLDR